MKKVSLIIPIYNVEEYLEECLNSVVEQTIDDYEIICVDDGSTDCSGKIANAYATKYSNINVIQKENEGLSVARNVGLEAAQGKYIYFLDSDDYIERNTLEELYNRAEADRLDLIYFNTETLYEDKMMEEKYPKYKTLYKRDGTYRDIYSGQTLFVKMIQNNDFLCNVGIQFFKSNFLREYRLRFFPGIIYEDELFSFQVAMYAKRAVYIDKIYHHRRVHKGSIVTTPKTMKNVESHLYSYIEAISFVKTLDIKEADIPYVKNYIKRIYRHAMFGYKKMKRKGKATLLENKDVVFQYVYEDLKRKAKQERKNEILKNENAKLLKQIEDLKNSKSYRIGRIITFIPRKIRDCEKKSVK